MEEPGEERAQVEILESGIEELSLEEAERLAVLAMKSKQPQPGQLLRLERAYALYETKEILAGICSHYIREDRTDARAFSGYLKGVEKEVKITNLYEFFMRGALAEYREPIPKNVLLYFLYNNTLSASQKAFLYANVVRYEDRQSSLYREYRRLIEPFMLEQLLQRRIWPCSMRPFWWTAFSPLILRRLWRTLCLSAGWNARIGESARCRCSMSRCGNDSFFR